MRLRRGLFRLYVVLTMLWIGWFGYEIYAAQRSASKATDYIQMYDYERQIGRVPAFNRSELVVWQIQQTKRRETALQALLVFPLLLRSCSSSVTGLSAASGETWGHRKAPRR
jgi:hypothetical protein